MGGFAADDRSRTQALFEFLREIMLAAAIRELIIGVLELYWPGPDNDARAPQISATLFLRGIVGSLAISSVHVVTVGTQVSTAGLAGSESSRMQCVRQSTSSAASEP